MTESGRLAFIGKHATVTWDPKRCMHSGRCAAGLPAVFGGKADPWIRPDLAERSLIAEVVARCPSGALRVEDSDGGSGPGRSGRPHTMP